MKLVVFGLTISSSWGNGHATLWRGLCRALARRGHQVVFFERDVPYYAEHRDMPAVDDATVILYRDWNEVSSTVRRELSGGGADVAMVTSYCPDGVAATAAVTESNVLGVFYDLDTPVTLDHFKAGDAVAYLGPNGLADFDLVLSFTGGRALTELSTVLGARRVVPCYGHVDPDVHRPATPMPWFQSDLSYLGTYSADRQDRLEQLFIEPARRAAEWRFCLAGAQYPDAFPWAPNIFFVRHLPPAQHAAFFSSSRLTLNVTRRAMAQMGFCPSGRLFEAAACGVPIVSDWWEGLESFFTPGEEILVANGAEDTLDALRLPADELHRIAVRARERTLDEHTADRRAAEMELAIESCADGVAGSR
jgi:spore maturation protein CgeB